MVATTTNSGNKIKRFALFLPTLAGGGAERVALALMQAFIDRGYTVDLVLSTRKGALLPLVPSEVEVFDLGTPKLRQAVGPLARYLRKRRPEALHAMMWPLPLLAVTAGMIAKVDTRIIGSEHATMSAMPLGLQHRWIRAVTRLVYSRLDGLIAVSAGVADDFADLISLPRERISVIHNPLMLPGNLPDRSAAASHWQKHTNRILAVGALKSEKNYPLLLHALAKVRKTVPASLVILGEGPLLDDLQMQVISLGLEDAVTFVGFQTDPWPFYAAADVFVLSSDSEGFGNVLIEAMHAGLPVVSTDCPNGPREILDGGRFGTLTACGDLKQMVNAIVKAIVSPKDSCHARSRATTLSGPSSIESHVVLMLGENHSLPNN